MTEVKDHVLVKRGLYYRPNGNGYTGLKCEAGLYEASYGDGDEWITAIPFADAPEFAPACWEETKLSHLQGQIATARAELAAAHATIHQLGENAAKAAGEYAGNMAAMRAESARLREALEYCKHEAYCSVDPEHGSVDRYGYGRIEKRARAALTEPTDG